MEAPFRPLNASPDPTTVQAVARAVRRTPRWPDPGASTAFRDLFGPHPRPVSTSGPRRGRRRTRPRGTRALPRRQLERGDAVDQRRRITRRPPGARSHHESRTRARLSRACCSSGRPLRRRPPRGPSAPSDSTIAAPSRPPRLVADEQVPRRARAGTTLPRGPTPPTRSTRGRRRAQRAPGPLPWTTTSRSRAGGPRRGPDRVAAVDRRRRRAGCEHRRPARARTRTRADRRQRGEPGDERRERRPAVRAGRACGVQREDRVTARVSGTSV